MQIIREAAALRQAVAAWRAAGEMIGLAPTMGALHAGHLSLVQRAKMLAGRVIVSIFVNPKQFIAGEDFALYPRRESEDAALLAAEGADLLYAPPPEEIYPPGFATTVSVAGLGDLWEGVARPGHFAGMTTVVAKLFIQSGADIACFGEKDYQQLQLVKRLARDLDLPIQVVGCPTVRDASGLALSSRNAYLTATELTIAQQFNQSLREAVAEARHAPDRLTNIADAAATTLLAAGFDAVDYCAFVDAETLTPLERLRDTARLIAAVRLRKTRLLDNFAV